MKKYSIVQYIWKHKWNLFTYKFHFLYIKACMSHLMFVLTVTLRVKSSIKFENCRVHFKASIYLSYIIFRAHKCYLMHRAALGSYLTNLFLVVHLVLKNATAKGILMRVWTKARLWHWRKEVPQSLWSDMLHYGLFSFSFTHN